MKLGFCKKQKEVSAALREGRWPGACDSSLLAHVADCQECNDLVLVAETLQQARGETMGKAQLVSPETLWWRRELQRRSAVVERVTLPVAVIEKLALIAVPLAMLAVGVWQWNEIAGWIFPSQDLSSSGVLRWDSLWTLASGAAAWAPLLLMASLGTFALIWGLVLLMVTGKD